MIKKLLFVGALISTAFAQEYSARKVELESKFENKVISNTTVNINPQIGYFRATPVTNDTSSFLIGNQIQNAADPNSPFSDLQSYVLKDYNGDGSTFPFATQELPFTPVTGGTATLKGINFQALSIADKGSSDVVVTVYDKEFNVLGQEEVNVVANAIYDVNFSNGGVTFSDTISFTVEPKLPEDSLVLVLTADYNPNYPFYNPNNGLLVFDMSANGGQGGLFAINNSATIIGETWYDYNLESNFLISTDCPNLGVTIDGSANSANFIASSPIINSNAWVFALQGAPLNTSAVDFGDGSAVVEFNAGVGYNYTQTGNYNLQALTSVARWNQEQAVDVQQLNADFTSCQTTGINDLVLNNVSLYPNPATSKVTINFGEQVNGTVRVLDLTGRTISEKEVNALSTDLNVSDYNGGLYIVQVVIENNVVATSKFNVAK